MDLGGGLLNEKNVQVGLPNQILVHEDVDVDHMLQFFRHKYDNAICDSYCASDLPPLSQEHFVFQKKSPDKAASFDRWNCRALQQLPPTLEPLICW